MSRRLSFGTAIDAPVDAPGLSQADTGAEEPNTAAHAETPPVQALFVDDDSSVVVEGTPTPKAVDTKGKRK